MKKAIMILAICSLLLTACGQIDDTESKAETTATAVSESTTDTETSSAKEEKDTSEATTTTKKSSQTASSSSNPTGTTVITTKISGSSNANGYSNQGQNNSVQNNNGQVNNYQPSQNNQQQPDNSPSDNDQSNNGAQQNNQPTDNKPQNNNPSPPVTTAKPAVTNPPTTTTPKPQTTVQKTDVTTTAATVQDITSLKSFVQDIDTGYYQNIGKGFGSYETDYQKAQAIFDWEVDNGNGSCISYAIQTYYLCKGAELECAYAFMTSNGWYGHVYNVVKVDGNWYVFDTQGECFLGSDYVYTKIFDENENTLNITLSENDY